MDYTAQKFAFQVSKVLRYVRIYGVWRTLIKIKGQYHMKKAYEALPKLDSQIRAGGHIGLIGSGNYSFSNVAYYLRKEHGAVIRGAMDTNIHRAASLYEHYGLRYYTDDARKIIADPAIDSVFIASNHASHADYAIECINAGKDVHIEKPHVVSENQLSRLASAMRAHPESKVFLGFNRPRSVLFKELQELLSAQRGPMMINWFIAGHEIPDGHWYFDEKEGGRVLGNLCHWTDLTLRLVGMSNAFPCTIVPATPAGSKSDYVVSVLFADKSCASITFSAKGHTFEGVREVLNIHRGDLLANLTDFHSLTAEVVAKKTKHRLLHRDHGQEANILNSSTSKAGEDPAYIISTAKFFLAIRQAIDSGQTVVLGSAETTGCSS